MFAAASSGRLPIETLRTAAARVQKLSEWFAGDVAETGNDDVDWVSVAARAARVDSLGATPVLGGSGAVTLVDARTGHNMAAGPTENFIATALGGYTVSAAHAQATPAPELAALLAGSQGAVLAIVDSLASAEQRATVEFILAEAPQAVVINAGLVTDAPTENATIHCHGFSRVSAEAVVSLLETA